MESLQYNGSYDGAYYIRIKLKEKGMPWIQTVDTNFIYFHGILSKAQDRQFFSSHKRIFL
jgi:hypothetical protein